jgi:8-amino-7-oxononanoate synthase
MADARARGLFRDRPPPRATGALSFCSNDYLALAERSAAPGASGAGASRLVSGDRQIHADLEAAAASLVLQPASLVFTSGYAANVGLLSALAGPEDLIVSDALNHASLIDGARLSRARIAITPHRDLEAVARALRAQAWRRAFVVTESYFSMDADSPDLRALRSMCDDRGAALVVDEAHALGVLGEGGRGLCAELGVRADALVGTFGKAFGAGGAFVAGSDALVAWLWNRARSFVFSTGLSPAVAASALDGLRRSQNEPLRRERVRDGGVRLRTGLRSLGANVVGYGHVIPWIVGEPADGVRLASALQARGVDVRAIRPPSVPPGTARLRFTVTADHRPEDIDAALRAVEDVRAGGRAGGPRADRHPDAERQRQGRAGRRSTPGRLVIVAGTGTSIGKTHACEALVRAWRAMAPDETIVAIKPVESGVADPERSDTAVLSAASSFHVKPLYRLRAPLSPHLAARDEGVDIRLDAIAGLVDDARVAAHGVVVELPGGLFTPIAEGVCNADLVRRLAPDELLLVAPDRLGVLHDVGATARAAIAASVHIRGVILVAPPEDDPSTGRNAAELPAAAGLVVLARLPRASAVDLSGLPALSALVRDIRRGRATEPDVSGGTTALSDRSPWDQLKTS